MAAIFGGSVTISVSALGSSGEFNVSRHRWDVCIDHSMFLRYDVRGLPPVTICVTHPMRPKCRRTRCGCCKSTGSRSSTISGLVTRCSSVGRSAPSTWPPTRTSDQKVRGVSSNYPPTCNFHATAAFV